MTARLEIYSPKVAGKTATIEEFAQQSLAALSERGRLVEGDFENGIFSVSKESTQPRVYTVPSGAGDRVTSATLDYFRILQQSGDPTLPLAAQDGRLQLRDFAFQINEIETGFYRRTIPTGSTTEVVGTETLRCGIEMPVYVFFPEQIKNLLGNYGELYDLVIIERTTALPDEITTQLASTIRISYSIFTVDFTSLSNPYIRQPVLSPTLSYTVRQTANLGAAVAGTYKQHWPIQGAELTLGQLTTLRSLLSKWREDVKAAIQAQQSTPSITLVDLTSQIAEPTPRTRAIGSGTVTATGGIDQYFGSFNVGHNGPIDVSAKDGDSTKVLVNIAFGELGASA